jgi:predicted NBD/HSP70 family sugar kinase
VVLALVIAVDSVAGALVGFGGEVLHSVRIDRPRGHLSVDETVQAMMELGTVVGALPPLRDDVLAIGVAMYGVVRRADGFVSLAPNLGWHDVPLGERLKAAFDTSAPIFIGNEADLGALAEHRRGAAKGYENVLFISGEVGVGGGLIVDGKPLTGVAGYGGEIGHMPVNPSGSACRCGSVGCWETEVAEGALLRRAGRAPGGGRPEVEAVLRDAAEGDPAALSALDTTGHWLGHGIAGLINVINPRLVVLGGLFSRIYPFVADTLDAELQRRALRASLETATIVPATLGVDAPLIGAAELAFEPLLADPAAWRPVRQGPWGEPSRSGRGPIEAA